MDKTKNKVKKRNRITSPISRIATSGQTLLIILLVMAVVLTVALSVVSRSITNVAISEKEEEASRAFSAAEAGIEKVLLTGNQLDSGTVGTNDNFSVTSAYFGQGTSFVYPQLLSAGDTAPIWLTSRRGSQTVCENPPAADAGEGASLASSDGSVLQAAASWYNPNWQYRKKIEIQASQVDSNLTDFPVLINLSDDNELKDNAQNDGDDILFTAADGTNKLDHEIEKFGNNGELIAWVKVNSVSGSTNTDIYMYYGNPTVGTQSNPTGVWDSNYLGVWHLNENGNGTAGEFKDSSGNNNHGQGGEGSNTATPAKTGGVIYNAQSFNSSQNDRINIPSQDSFNSLAAMTIEGWVWLTGSGPGGDDGAPWLACKGDGNGGEAWCVDGATLGTNNHLRFYRNSPFNGCTELQTPIGAWHHYVATYDGASGTVELFADGSQLKQSDQSDNNCKPFTSTTLGSNTNPIYFGSRRSSAGGSWLSLNGNLDEIRISNTARSASWIRTEYNNQNSPSSFYVLGSQEVYVAPTNTPTPTPTPAPGGGNGGPCFTGTTLEICWGEQGAQNNIGPLSPAIEVSINYKTGNNLDDNKDVQIARAALDPYSSRGNNFDTSITKDGSCSIDSTQFAFSKTIDLSGLGVTQRSSVTDIKGAQVARIRMLYNTDKAHPVGVKVNSGTLPDQGSVITSTGTAGEAKRKIEVNRLFPDIPSIFEFGLFSGAGGLTK